MCFKDDSMIEIVVQESDNRTKNPPDFALHQLFHTEFGSIVRSGKSFPSKVKNIICRT